MVPPNSWGPGVGPQILGKKIIIGIFMKKLATNYKVRKGKLSVIITGTLLVKFWTPFFHHLRTVSLFKLFIFTVVKSFASDKRTCGPDLL